MSMKNRTIPMTTKEEAEIQTDVNLINQNQMEQVRRSSSPREIRFSSIVSESILLKSFSPNQVFQQLTNLIGDLRKQSVGSENIQKRLSLIEKEIHGLMKRDLLIQQPSQKDHETTDYYSIISQLQKQKIRLEYQLSYNGIKTQRYQRRIVEMERQLKKLRETIDLTKNSLLENQVYKDFITSLKQEKKIDSKRLSDLERQLMRKVGNGVREINVEENNDKARELWMYFAKRIEGMQNERQLTMENLNKELFGLYQMSSLDLLDKDLSTSFSFKSRYEDLQSKYQDLRSVFKHQVETIIKDNPAIKGLKSLQELIELTDVNESEVELINIAGWVGIGRVTQGVEYFAENEQNKQSQVNRTLVHQLATQLKQLIVKYPKLVSQLSKQTTFFLQNSSLLHQLISTQSLSRVKQIITYQPDIVRVDNVYQFSNKKDQQLVFNLRVLIKALLEELEVIRKQYNVEVTMDAGLMEMIRGQVIEGVDVQDVLALYRPLPKIVEVQRVVQKPVYINNSIQKSIPICTQRAILAQTISQKPISITKQVPIYIQKVINNPINQYIEVLVQNQKIIQVPTIREVVVEKVVVNQKLNDIEVERIVPVYEDKIVQIQNTKEIVVERTKVVQIQKPIQVTGPKEYVEIQKVIQKPIYLKDIRQKIRQVEIINQKIFQHDRYIQIQRQVPHIITNRQTVYLDRQVPRFITNTEQKEVNVTQVIEKIVPYKVVEEKVVEVPVVREKEIVKEVEKEVVVEVTHFVKGDREEVIKQVEVIVQKPLREEYLITKQLEVQKVIPLYYKQQKPVYFQMQLPYIQSQPKIINQQVARIVPLREQIIKEVHVQVPVPVIVQKQVIRTQTIYVDKIIQKIVEVPRIVEIQKIVEKIVPIPRIIQKIIQVPRVIQKLVTIQVPYLQIVQVFRQLPVIKQVEVVRQVIIQKPVIEYVKEIEIVEKQKIVEIVVEKQVPKEIQVERRIPTEVVRQVPVEVYRDRVVEKIVEIHEVTVKDRQVMVPFTHQVPVQLIVQKPIITQKIIESIVRVPQVIEKQKPIIQTITIPEIVQVKIEKPIEIEVVRQIPGPETIKYIEVPRQVELLRQKVVRVQNIVQIPKQVYLMMDNIVYDIHQKSFPIHIPTLIQQPYIVEVNNPTHHIHYKQIPIQVQTTRNIPIRSFIDQVKQVQKHIHHQLEVETIKQKIKEIVNQTTKFIQKQVPKELLREVVVNETKIESLEIPGQTRIIQNNNTIVHPHPTSNYIQKVVQRIVMLPQIVQVVKHFHSISQIQSPGVAVNTTIQQQTKQFVSVSTQLHIALTDLLEKLKQNNYRISDLKNVIPIIEGHLGKVQEWIKLPKIVEVQKIVEKPVEKDKIVLVPTVDHQKQASLSYLVQKLVLELRRIKQRNRIELQLQEDIQRLFFKDPKLSVISEKKVEEFNQLLKQKYNSLGEWKQSYPFMIDSFLQDYFTLNSTITQLSNTNTNLQQNLNLAQTQLETNSKEIIAMQSHNSELLRNYDSLLDELKGFKDKGMEKREVQIILKEYGLTKYEEKKLSRIEEDGGRVSGKGSRSSLYNMEERGENAKLISNLISKTEKLEAENLELSGKVKSYEKQVKLLENEIQKYKSQVQKPSSSIKAIEQIKSRLINENEQKIKRLQQSQNQQISRLKTAQQKQLQRLKAAQQKEIQRLRDQKISAQNSQLVNENRRLTEQLRNVRRDLQVQKRLVQALKQQHEREMDNLNKQHELNLQKKDSNISSLQTVKARISDDYERKINQLREFYQKQLERLKLLPSMRKDDVLMDNDDIKQKQTTELRDRVKSLQIELESTRKQIQLFQQQQKSKLISTTAYTGSPFISAIKQATQSISRRQLTTQGFTTSQRTKFTAIETYQSAMQRKYVSPSSVKSRQDDGSSLRSSSSRKSQIISKYKPHMTLRQFMDSESKQDKDLCSTFIMIKIIEKIQEQARHGILHSFSPSNIYLINLNSNNFDSLTIKFGAPIVNKNNKNDGLYLAPQILGGQKPTQKSIVFTLAVIWDELIHGQIYFKSIRDIENPQVEFKVRDAKLNPILKNTLFEMMNKDQVKRLQLHQTKRRLSLQKYIASESKR